MIQTIDKNGIKRNITKYLWDKLPFNKDGSKGVNRLNAITEKAEVTEIDTKIADLIKKKKEEKEAIQPVKENPIADEVPEVIPEPIPVVKIDRRRKKK